MRLHHHDKHAAAADRVGDAPEQTWLQRLPATPTTAPVVIKAKRAAELVGADQARTAA